MIPPGTQTTVEATLNTTNFQGYKASGLTLILDRPAFVEVDLNLTCFIRGDIVMNPGQIDFGPRGIMVDARVGPAPRNCCCVNRL